MILMLVVNLIVIVRMMQHTPLQFLRHDLKKTKNKKAMRLPGWSFLAGSACGYILPECHKLPDFICRYFLYHGHAGHGSGHAIRLIIIRATRMA